MSFMVKLQEFERELTLDDLNSVTTLMRSVLSRDIELSRSLPETPNLDEKIVSYRRQSAMLVSKLRSVIRSEEPIDVNSIEHMWVIGLTADARVAFLSLVALGDVHRLAVAPIELLKPFKNEHCRRMIVVHTHPTDVVVTPSQGDVEFTKRMLYACKQFNISLQDHIILGRNDIYSFYQSDQLLPLFRELEAENKDKVALEKELHYQTIMRQQAEHEREQVEREKEQERQRYHDQQQQIARKLQVRGMSLEQIATIMDCTPQEIEVLLP